MKVHLVDGTFELFRAYYGAPGSTSDDGREVGATRALLRSFNALLQQKDVTHVAVAFDHVIESFRNELFDGYKTGAGIEPALWSQFELAERATEALGIVSWPLVEFEADDGLATAASRFVSHPEVEQIVICSPDKDLAQCVRGTKVVCFDRIRRKTLDEEGVRAKFGVEPALIPDYLALVGDNADGIPGIPRWGAKSTATVLSRYGGIEGIPASADDWDIKVRGAAQLAENLSAERDEAGLYKVLATLRTDVPQQEGLADLEWRGARRRELTALCEEIGESQLLERVTSYLDG